MSGNSNSGRRRLPATVHVLRGNPSKKSAEELATAVAAAEAAAKAGKAGKKNHVAPTCPDFLSPDAKTEWRRIINDLCTLGIVTKIDRAALAAYCQAWAQWKHATQKIKELGDTGFVEATGSGYKQMSAWMQVANRAEERMLKAGALFGLNPSARASLEVRPPQAELFPNDEKEKAAKYF